MLRDKTRKTKWRQRHGHCSCICAVVSRSAFIRLLWIIAAVIAHHKDVDYMDIIADLNEMMMLFLFLAEIPESCVRNLGLARSMSAILG